MATPEILFVAADAGSILPTDPKFWSEWAASGIIYFGIALGLWYGIPKIGAWLSEAIETLKLGVTVVFGELKEQNKVAQAALKEQTRAAAESLEKQNRLTIEAMADQQNTFVSTIEKIEMQCRQSIEKMEADCRREREESRQQFVQEVATKVRDLGGEIKGLTDAIKQARFL